MIITIPAATTTPATALAIANLAAAPTAPYLARSPAPTTPASATPAPTAITTIAILSAPATYIVRISATALNPRNVF